MPEVTDEQWSQALNLDTFVRRALSTPKNRRKILEIQKDMHPDVAIPEIDESDPINKRLDAMEEREQKRESERAEKEQLNEFATRWMSGQAVAKKRGFTDDSLKNLEEFMHEHGIASHEHAIPAYQELHPPPTPVRSSSTRWDFFGPQQDAGLDLKLLYEGKDDEWLEVAVADTLNKVRSGEITR